MLALIDGDIIAYRAASVQQENYNWGDGVTSTSLTGDVEQVRALAIELVEQWIALAGCDDARVCLSCPSADGFRRALMPTYKMNRTTAKPLMLPDAKAAIAERWKTDMVPGLEADDLLGILATRLKDRAVVVSLDKDMWTIPGKHFNPQKDRFVRSVSVREADTRWMTQTLTGDTSDGYTGLPKVGPVKAAKILGGIGLAEELWPKVVRAYAERKLTEDDALLQARVARILRNEDYDPKTKEVILWSPATTAPRTRLSIPITAVAASSPAPGPDAQDAPPK